MSDEDWDIKITFSLRVTHYQEFYSRPRDNSGRKLDTVIMNSKKGKVVKRRNSRR